jgi:hypothetical protein
MMMEWNKYNEESGQWTMSGIKLVQEEEEVMQV